MKEIKPSEFLQREADLTANIFCSKFKQPQLDENLCNQGDKTATSEAPMSGEWRTNVMIQSSPNHQTLRTLCLRHLTSFEENSMEDHGKILRKTLESYLQIYNIRFDKDQEFYDQMKSQFTSWDEVEVCLLRLQNLEETKKNFLLKFCQRNLQAQLVLRLIFINVPEEFLVDSLAMASQIFQDYLNEKVELKDEDEIETFVSLTYSDTAEKIKLGLSDSDLLPRDAEGQHRFQEMIGVWMQTIFLALNGVFENPQDRKTPIYELQGFDTFYESRKLIKID